MKTSNILLLGLLILFLLIMIVGNIYLKEKIDNNSSFNNQIEMKTSSDSLSIINDSLEMDDAIKNR